MGCVRLREWNIHERARGLRVREGRAIHPHVDREPFQGDAPPETRAPLLPPPFAERLGTTLNFILTTRRDGLLSSSPSLPWEFRKRIGLHPRQSAAFPLSFRHDNSNYTNVFTMVSNTSCRNAPIVFALKSIRRSSGDLACKVFATDDTNVRQCFF